MLSNLTSLRLALRLKSGDTSQDAYLTSLLAIADAAVKSFCHRELEQANYQEFMSGSGVETLALRQRPIQAAFQAGTLTSGSKIVTGLSDTSVFLANQAVSGQGVAPGSTLQSIDSATQVHLSKNATLSGSYVVAFGIAVWLDAGGFGGQAPGAFADSLQLIAGVDYMVDIDPGTPAGASKSGLLYRLGGGLLGTPASFFMDYRRGSLTAQLAPPWARGYRNIKTCYTAGFATIPADLTHACNMLACWIRTLVPVGVPIDVESVSADVSAILRGHTGGGGEPEIGSVRMLLRKYRDVVL